MTSIVHVEVSGLTGSGKSAVMGEIEIALKALGLKVEYGPDFQAEKNGTHADWQTALDLYQPTVVLSERNISRQPPAREDALPVATGDGAKALERASPTILNLAWAEPLMWDGRKDTLEEQATGPIEAAGEMNQPIASLVAELSDIPAYRRLFREAFGSETISGTAIARALATFERTIVSNRAPFDRWIDGDDTAISEQAKQGFSLFNGKANCAACHSGWRFTDDSFHDIGLTSADPGRGALLPDIPIMRHAFKTPTLRNVATREPFMHDGSAATLRDVLAHYDTGFIERSSLSPEMHRLGLTAQETEALLAFLRTLTSEDDPIPVPALPTKDASS